MSNNFLHYFFFKLQQLIVNKNAGQQQQAETIEMVKQVIQHVQTISEAKKAEEKRKKEAEEKRKRELLQREQQRKMEEKETETMLKQVFSVIEMVGCFDKEQKTVLIKAILNANNTAEQRKIIQEIAKLCQSEMKPHIRNNK